jgi:hypothetical protein
MTSDPILALAVVLFLQTAAAPIVVGEQRDALTPADVSAISALTVTRPAWLIDAFDAGDPVLARVLVYLKPDRTTSTIRRGSLVMVSRGRSGATATPRPWIINEQFRAEYAQVPIDGRDADDVREAVDENRPFRVTGDLSDADLVGIVRYIRSARIGSGPIVQITRDTAPTRNQDADVARVDIMMRALRQCYDIVTVRRVGGSWQQAPGAGGACP